MLILRLGLMLPLLLYLLGLLQAHLLGLSIVSKALMNYPTSAAVFILIAEYKTFIILPTATLIVVRFLIKEDGGASSDIKVLNR
jgi:hypothetical protein